MHHPHSRALAGNMALAGWRQPAWPVGNTTPLPVESLGGQQPEKRQQERGKYVCREVGYCHFLLAWMTVEKEMEGRIPRVS